jgi:hypothetical protein
METVDDQVSGNVIMGSNVLRNGIEVAFPHIGGEMFNRPP